MLYDWPVSRRNRTHPRLGALGEFRGLGANDITRVHSGTDIARAGGNVQVWSPDTGLVRRHTPAANGNPSGGGGPIRVGHFSFNHITTVNARPGGQYNGVALPQNLPIHVVEPGSAAYAPRPGVANPQNDADFRRGRVGRAKPAVAYRKIGPNNYERGVFWPRNLPIGTGVQPTDLHCIYYESADGPYADGGNAANCLEVFRNYTNRRKPVAEKLVMYTQVGKRAFLDLGRRGNTATHRAAMGGLDFMLWAHSPFNSKCGVYQIEYEILNHLGNTTRRLNVWRFHDTPPDNRAFDIVDPQLSRFNTVNNKFTVYTITNSRNANINAAYHWEVENPGQWPDGCYAIKVWLKNIRASVGVGRAPTTNERYYVAEWTVKTQANGNRKLTVTRSFRAKAANYQPSFRECANRGKRKPRGKGERR